MIEHPCADHRNALDVHLTATRALLADHLRHEETEALPLVQRRLTGADWALSEKAAAPRMMPFMLGWVFQGVTADQMAGLRPMLLLLWRLVVAASTGANSGRSATPEARARAPGGGVR